MYSQLTLRQLLQLAHGRGNAAANLGRLSGKVGASRLRVAVGGRLLRVGEQRAPLRAELVGILLALREREDRLELRGSVLDRRGGHGR